MIIKAYCIHVSLIALIGVTSVAHAQADRCAPQEAAVTFPKAIVAMDEWEKTRATVLADSVKGKVLVDFCKAGKSYAADKNVAHDTVNAASIRVMSNYLDRAADPAR